MPMTQDTADAHILERLYAVIESRRGADPGTSYTAKLFSKGTEKIARKLAEESVEALIEGIKGDRDRLAAESAERAPTCCTTCWSCGPTRACGRRTSGPSSPGARASRASRRRTRGVERLE